MIVKVHKFEESKLFLKRNIESLVKHTLERHTQQKQFQQLLTSG